MIMPEAKASMFLDSNIVLYAIGDDDSKRGIAASLLAAWPVISTQVVNECSHVLRRKLKMAAEQVSVEMEAVIDVSRLHEVGIREIRNAWQVAERYGFGHYDSLIVASALSAGCSTLYSEDMQHGQVIQDRLTILNPFVAVAST